MQNFITYTFYPTDMDCEFISYENVGITPQVLLKYKSHWLAQTLEIIKSGL
jgi:hypothetical protein